MANVPGVNGTQREGFGERSITTSGEQSQAALTARATASVQARYVVAMQRPRSWDDVRVRILSECKRPGFAETARYLKPIGKGVSGPSIRFAEACFRYAGNLGADTTTTFEDRMKRVLSVVVTDYETNASYSAEITIEKTVERKDTKGRVIVAERTNSYGDAVFIVESTEDELLNKINALVSKAARTLILRLIPGDIVEEGQAMCIETKESDARRDPAGEKKKICDAFGGIGVMPKDLALYVGHSLDAIQPAELVELRQVFATIRDGEATWAAIMESKGVAKTEEPRPTATTQASTIADKVKAKTAKKETPPPAAVPHDKNTGEVKEEPKAAQPPPAAGGVKVADLLRKEEAPPTTEGVTFNKSWSGAPADDGKDDAGAEAALGREPGEEG